jgi:transposase
MLRDLMVRDAAPPITVAARHSRPKDGVASAGLRPGDPVSAEDFDQFDIARFKTRLEHIDEPRLKRIVNSDIARLKARKTAQSRMLAKHLRGHEDLARRLDLVLSIPGIGERTALALIIRMPELGRSPAMTVAGPLPTNAGIT